MCNFGKERKIVVGVQAILLVQKSIITKLKITTIAIVATTIIARHLLSLC